MQLLATFNPENVSELAADLYRRREAARAVVIDDADMVALLYVKDGNYYKLPGGGIKQGEDPVTALKRECLEEVGVEIEVLDDIGVIVEYKKPFNLKQTSYCYVARVKGEKGMPAFTKKEIKEGFELAWVAVNDAKQLLAEGRPTTLESSDYIIPRDRLILETGLKTL